MAVVVTDLRTTVDEADTITGWTGASGTSTAVFVETGAAVIQTLNIATGQVYFTVGTAIDLSDTLVYVWSNNFAQHGGWEDAQPPNALHLGDGTNSISFKIAGSDRKVFSHLAGQDWNWDCLVLDGSQAATMDTNGLTVARAGSFGALALTAITNIGSDFTTQSKGIGGGINVAVDIIRYGNDGLQITGGTTSDRGLFSQIVTEDSSTATLKAHGIIRELATGLYSCQGPLNFGDATTATESWFDDSGRVLSFENRNISNDKYYIRVRGHTSATNFFRLNNTTITTAGPFVRCDFNGGNVDTLTITNNTFTGLGNAITFSNLADATGHTVTGNVFTSCGQIDPGDVTFQDNTISNSTAGATGAVLLDADGTANWQDLAFVGGTGIGHGVYITATGTYSFNGLSFTGFGADGTTDAAVYNNSGGAVTINVSGGGDTPTVLNGTSASTTVNNNINVTLTGLRDNTEVRVLDNTTGAFLAGIEDATTGTTDDRSFTFSLSAGVVVDIAIFNVNFVLPPNNRIVDFTIPTTDASIPISQIRDRNYVNP